MEPHGCALDAFDPSLMLEGLRGRTLWIWGDSLAKQQFDALRCQLGAVARAQLQSGYTNACDKDAACAPKVPISPSNF